MHKAQKQAYAYIFCRYVWFKTRKPI